MQLNTRKVNNPMKKWREDLNTHFSKENRDMADKHTQKCSMSLIIREMKIKIAMTYYLISVRMTIIKRLKIINAGEGVEKREPSYTVSVSAN